MKRVALLNCTFLGAVLLALFDCGYNLFQTGIEELNRARSGLLPASHLLSFVFVGIFDYSPITILLLPRWCTTALPLQSKHT